MNIATQLCGLTILVVILFFYHRQQKVDFRSSRLFGVAILADLGCLILDILSIFGIVYSGNGVDPIATGILCKLYLLALVFMAYIGFSYAVSQMPVTEKGGGRMEKCAMFIYAVAAVLIIALPISYKTDGLITYSYGKACYLAYFFAPFFMIMTYLIALFYRKELPVNVFATISFWIGAECFAALMQFLNPGWLVVGFASSVGLCVVYLELENPELQKDRSSGLFNLSTFQSYIVDFYKKDLQFSYIFVKLVYDLASPADSNGAVMRHVADYLREFRQAKTFYVGQSGYIMVFRDPAEAAETAGEINEALTMFCHEHGNSFLEILETQGRRANSINEIMELLGQISLNGEYSDSGIITVTDDTYERFRQERSIIKEIDDALDDDRVEAFFQPIYSFEDDAFTGAEALARIRRKDGSIMTPGLFITVAEKTGQVTRIGDRMFEK
ncbi:MAG: EAL domain-containing protein, partial [Lachnospiraceae bacterium]|nr:EAL domain-containing protein [Lachnospiraceae bacterium]